MKMMMMMIITDSSAEDAAEELKESMKTARETIQRMEFVMGRQSSELRV